MDQNAQPTDAIVVERPDLVAWKQRHELRRSNASVPIPSAKTYKRKDKYPYDRT